jgi:2-keto-4-pentenoate hydratase/2-oxohepta-3-ene-1,7-dioic acid hydratase in catechol pathway
MKFISFTAQGRASYGTLVDGSVHDLGARIGSVLPDLKSYLRAQSLGLLASAQSAGTTADYAVKDIVFDAVIPNPEKVICVGINYLEHQQETGRSKTDYPTIFTRFPDTLIAHQQQIVLPKASSSVDYEGELAVIIGRAGFHVPKEKALDIVAGYSCFNDASVRDWQRHTSQFTPGKNFPATGPLGPVLETEAQSGFADRKLETRLNGKVLQSAKLGDMIFSVPEVIAYVTAFTQLAPGDVIATGTPGGVGFKREPPLFMKHGDKVEVLIEGVGHLVNDVVSEK